MIDLQVTGHVVPYVRTTQKMKHVDERYQLYAAWQSGARLQIKNQMQLAGTSPFPASTPLAFLGGIIYVYGGLHKGDLDNQLKALIDACQGVLFKNDQWIDFIGPIVRVPARSPGTEVARFRVGLMIESNINLDTFGGV